MWLTILKSTIYFVLSWLIFHFVFDQNTNTSGILSFFLTVLNDIKDQLIDLNKK